MNAPAVWIVLVQYGTKLVPADRAFDTKAEADDWAKLLPMRSAWRVVRYEAVR